MACSNSRPATVYTSLPFSRRAVVYWLLLLLLLVLLLPVELEEPGCVCVEQG